MECPYCKEEMEHGYIGGNHGVQWTQSCDQSEFTLWNRNRPGNMMLTSAFNLFLPAYRCSTCKKIIVKY